jgi:hypothetical protein
VVSRKPLSGKQTRPKGKTLSWKLNQIFLSLESVSVDWKVFPLTGKCFLLTNFSNGKQTQKSLKNGFPESKFQETNMAQKKLLFSKQTGL